MRGNSLLCYLIHSLAPYLHLHPSALMRHYGAVERLVAVALWGVYPVAQPLLKCCPSLCYYCMYIPALVSLACLALWLKDYPKRIDVIYLVE